MGLLQGHVPQPRAGDTLEDQWHQWIRQERLRRLGWAVYVSVEAKTNSCLLI